MSIKYYFRILYDEQNYFLLILYTEHFASKISKYKSQKCPACIIKSLIR